MLQKPYMRFFVESLLVNTQDDLMKTTYVFFARSFSGNLSLTMGNTRFLVLHSGNCYFRFVR